MQRNFPSQQTPPSTGRRATRRGYRAIKAMTALALATSTCVVSMASGPVKTYRNETATVKAAQSSDFEFQLAIRSDQPLINELGYDPLDRFDLSSTPFERGVIDIPGWKFGRYRRQGAHLVAMQNPTLAEHLRTLRRDVDAWVPVGYTGIVIIDYEPWWALWERTPNVPSDAAFDVRDKDYKDDWRDYIRAERSYLIDGLSEEQAESVFKRTYEAFMRTFLLTTYYRCKQLRPRAQWGFYNYPQVLIHSDLTPYGVQGYGDLTHEASRLNDEIAWFFEAVDVIAPRIYPSRRVLEQIPPEGRQPGEISASVHERWLSSMVRESVRLANGKPVLPYHSPIFYAQQSFGREPVSQYQHEEVFRILAENGASGVIIWHALSNREEVAQWERLWAEELLPAGEQADREINGAP